jgi:hypothetical protein
MLTISRGAYTAQTSATIQMTGNATVKWCRSRNSAGESRTYLPELSTKFPNRRITQLGMGNIPVCTMQVWYSDAPAADFVLEPDGLSRSLDFSLAVGGSEYFVSMDVWFWNDGANPILWQLILHTNAGRMVGIGGIPQRQGEGPFHVEVDPGQMIVALAWESPRKRISFDAVGIITMPNTYGG